jgi:hypothetical protein
MDLEEQKKRMGRHADVKKTWGLMDSVWVSCNFCKMKLKKTNRKRMIK